MPGKSRPSLREKTLQNVALSNLSLTDKQCIQSVFEKFEALSKADVVKHGEWILKRQSNGVRVHNCSICGRLIYTINEDIKAYAPYCHCGAKMGGSKKE